MRDPATMSDFPSAVRDGGTKMKRVLLLCLTIVVCLGFTWDGAPAPDSGKPQYTGDNQLLRPENYREWIYLSSGLGMNYSPLASGHQMFTNVFVPQWAYGEFLEGGKWPEKTMFVVEEREEETKGSIVKGGHYQSGLMGIGVEVKDARFPDKWAYFNFDESSKSAQANPKDACWQCHEDHAAVEHSFVQFYPTLKPVAKKFGTYKQAAETPVP
jgi:hypothetical protein